METRQRDLSISKRLKIGRYTLLSLTLILITYRGIAQQEVRSIENRLQDVDSVLNKIMKDQHLIGFSVAIVSGDQLIYSKGFGYRDIKEKKLVTENTQFAIGSCTKAFTAGLIGLLEKEGKLSFEGKATSYLPNLSFYNDDMNNNITIRDLMAHRTGFSGSSTSWYIFGTNDGENLLKRIKYMKPQVGVREKYIYNNYNYFIQGMITKKLTGKSWEEQIKSTYFAPLEMKNSTAIFTDFHNSKNASLGYEIDKDTIYKEAYSPPVLGAMAPAGGIYSTANDMANWLKMWINKGKYNNQEILPSSYVREATSSQMVATAEYPNETKDMFISNYGLGWGISSYRGYYAITHNGGIDGFSSKVGFFPTEKIGIVVLTNQSGWGNNVIYYALADRLLKVTPYDWNDKLKKSLEASRHKEVEKVTEPKKAQPKETTSPSHDLKDYVGKYYNPLYDTVSISLKNDSLFAGVGTENVLLMHEHQDVFTTRGIDFKKVNFRFSAMGKIDDFTIPFDGNQATVFKYVATFSK